MICIETSPCMKFRRGQNVQNNEKFTWGILQTSFDALTSSVCQPRVLYMQMSRLCLEANYEKDFAVERTNVRARRGRGEFPVAPTRESQWSYYT